MSRGGGGGARAATDDLSGMRPSQLVGRRKRDVGAEQRLDADRRGHAGRPRQPVSVGEEQRPDRAHELGAVQEREPFLGLEDERLEADLAKGDERGHRVAVELDRAASDERQRQMGKRRQVARRADGTLRRHDGMDTELEEGEQPVDEERPAAAVPQGQRVRPEQEHRPDDVPGQGRADACRVAHQQVLLQPRRVGRCDEPRRQGPEAGRDPVDDLAGGDEPLDDVSGLLHPRPSVAIERDGRPAAGDRLDAGDREVRPGQNDRLGLRGAAGSVTLGG